MEKKVKTKIVKREVDLFAGDVPNWYVPAVGIVCFLGFIFILLYAFILK
jgi:hypothetical protein